MLQHCKWTFVCYWKFSIPDLQPRNQLYMSLWSTSPAEKDLGGYWWMKSWTWPSNASLQPRRPTLSLVASKAAWPAGRGKWFCPSALLWWDPTQSPASSSGALNTRRTWTCWSRFRGGPQKRSEGCSTSPVRSGWESWGCSAWRKEGSRETLQ